MKTCFHLLHSTSVDAIDNLGRSALAYACEFAQEDMVEFLCACGATDKVHKNLQKNALRGRKRHDQARKAISKAIRENTKFHFDLSTTIINFISGAEIFNAVR